MNDGFGGILKACVVRRFARLCAQIAITGGLLTAGAASAEPALSFVRDTPYCYVSTTGRVSTTAFTVELWFKQTSFDSENQLFTQDNNGGTGRIFLYTRNGKPYFQVSGNGLTGNTNLTASTWYHFACVRDASGYGTVYIDGQAVTVPTYLNTDAAPSVTVTIGLLLRSKSGFRGDISDVRIWNTARSQTEIREAMRQRLTGIETGLAHYWPFGEGGGSTVYDRSGKADGTISGATWGYSADLPLSDPSGSWLSSSGGDWSDTANWLSGTPAQGVNVAAFFTNAPPTTITVNNDLTALTLHKLTVSGTNGITFTGNALTFTNLFLASQIATTCGSHRIALPIQTSGQKLFIETATPGALTFSGVIDGSGSVAVNPANSNGGSVAFTGANTYSGFTAVGCGTLSVATLDDGGAASAIGASSADPANLVIGPGTLHYTGASAVTDRGFTVNAGSRKAAVLRLDNDLTLIGPITNITGALIKTGPGTFTYAAPVASLIGRQQSAGITTQVPYPANGDSPANGFGCFTVAGGKVVLGADPAQTNLFSEEVTVGAYTTDQPGQEVSAELEIVGGYARFNTYFDIGYYNGNTVTAPTPLRPAVTVSGGLIDAAGLIMAFGYQTNQNTHAILNIAGGTLTVTGDFRFGDQTGSGMQATINVTSGALIHTSATVGLGSSRGGNNTLNLYGGLIDEYADLKMGANGSASRVSLNGGLLRVRTITGSTGHEYLTFNGGILQPRTPGQTMADDLLSTVVSTNGAIIDTSLAAYTIAQKLTHDPALGATPDGGLVKTGAHALTLAFTNATYTGTTRVSEGTLRVTGTLPPNNTVAIESDGEFIPGGNATQTFAVAALDLVSGATLGFTFKADGSSNDRLSLTSVPASFGTTHIALYRNDTSVLPFSVNGTYTLITYSGADPDVAGLTCAAPAPGKSYVFAAEAGAVTVTVGNGDAVWNTDANGTWSTAANWTTAPAAGGPARFDEVITASRTITTAGQTAGGLSFNNANAYTLNGSGLNLSGDATIAVERGAHTIAAPLTFADNAAIALSPDASLTLGSLVAISLTAQGNGTLNLNAAPALDTLTLDVNALGLGGSFSVTPPISLARTVTVSPATGAAVALTGPISGNGGLIKSGSSILTLGTANTYAGITTVKGGTLRVPAIADGGATSSIGRSSYASANLNLSGGTFHYTGPSASVDRGLTVNPGSNKAALLCLDNDLTVSGWINNTGGALIKTGPGTLRYTHANKASTIGANQSSSMGTQTAYPANGDAPLTGFGCFTVTDGKAIFGAPGQTNYFYGETTIGAYTTGQAGQETTGELEFIDGHSVFSSSLDIGYYNGTTLTAPVPLQPTVTVSGGTVNAVGIIMAFGYNNFGSAYPNTHGILNIAGGTLTVTGDFRFGDQTGSGMQATINVTSGALIHTSATVGLGSNRGGNNTLNLYGGLIDEYADLKMGANGSTSRVNLNGGILRVRTVTGSTGHEYLTFNGGILQPRIPGQTMADDLLSAVVSTNGAVIDTSLAAYTIAQKLAHDPVLGISVDGGLVKLGSNTLSLTSTGNTFDGPVAVNSGLLRARLGGTNALSVTADATFDALGERCTVDDLTGEGLLTNGVIAVTGTLDAGTNNAPAGAAMAVQNLSLAGGSTLACDWTTNALGQVTNDFVAVSNILASEGPGFLDLGRTETNAITVPFSATIMSYRTFQGTFTGWKAVNTGLPENKAFATVVTAADGFVTLEIRYGGTIILTH